MALKVLSDEDLKLFLSVILSSSEYYNFIKYLSRDYNFNNKMHPSTIISSCFNWIESEEGIYYWASIKDRIEKMYGNLLIEDIPISIF